MKRSASEPGLSLRLDLLDLPLFLLQTTEAKTNRKQTELSFIVMKNMV